MLLPLSMEGCSAGDSLALIERAMDGDVECLANGSPSLCEDHIRGLVLPLTRWGTREVGTARLTIHMNPGAHARICHDASHFMNHSIMHLGPPC